MLKPSFQDGRRILTVVQTARSDDRGEYRLFWLSPGKYYVSATHQSAKSPMERMMDGTGSFSGGGGGGQNFNMVRSTGDSAAAIQLFQQFEREAQREDHYVPIYFPGTISEQVVSPVDLSVGVTPSASIFPSPGSRTPRPRRRGQRRDRTGRSSRRVEGGPDQRRAHGRRIDDSAIDPTAVRPAPVSGTAHAGGNRRHRVGLSRSKFAMPT
jgi:hypothetical protein